MMPIKTMWRSAVAATTAWVNLVTPTSNFSTSSTVYVDVLDATAGNPITVPAAPGTLTVATGQSVLFAMAASWGGTGMTITMGVEFDDGINTPLEFDISIQNPIVNWTERRDFQNERLLTPSDVPAGTYTVTARVKTSSGTITLNAGDYLFMRALVF